LHGHRYRDELQGVVLCYRSVELIGSDAPVLTAAQRAVVRSARAAAGSTTSSAAAEEAEAAQPSHSKLGMIFLNRPHIHVQVRAKFLVFAPQKGQAIGSDHIPPPPPLPLPLLISLIFCIAACLHATVGVVNKVTDDNIGLLCYEVFNVSIAKSELPPDVCNSF
jgi:hypothetical protein